ncbi:glycosyltransferase [Altererythrobacter sp. MF3-039]|uniref:glycosyltransferase n=1 Tax=Altererythrobacter sp. MF3-039 TaxID=3252901 RepID=UPI00390C76E1
MGPGTQPLVIARNMRERGYETVFATAGGVYVDTVRDAGFPVAIIEELAPDKHNPVAVMRAISKLRDLIRRETPQVVHGHNAAATTLAWIAGRTLGLDIPCVTSVRGVEERESHQWRNGIWKRVPGKLIGVCEKTRERLLGFGCPPEKIVVTYNGIDLDRFELKRAAGAEARRELNLEGRLVVGTTGAMTGPADDLGGPGKGQHLLVRAAANLRDEFPELSVLLVGDGPARGHVETTVARLGMEDRVVFAGRRFDVPRMLAAMDIYCLASIYGEFFPNSIIEAMSMNLPWIGSDIAGLSELTADGDAGWVSQPGNVDALTANLRKLAANADLRSSMGARGRLEVEERFTIDKVNDRIESAYRLAGFSG